MATTRYIVILRSIQLTPNNTDWVLPVLILNWTILKSSLTAVLRWPCDTCPVCWFWRSDDGSSRERPLCIFVSPCSRKLDIEISVFADIRILNVSTAIVSLCNCVRIENTDTPRYLRNESGLVSYFWGHPVAHSGRNKHENRDKLTLLRHFPEI